MFELPAIERLVEHDRDREAEHQRCQSRADPWPPVKKKLESMEPECQRGENGQRQHCETDDAGLVLMRKPQYIRPTLSI